MSEILTKEDFNRLSQAGKLGNYLRTWDNYGDLMDSGYEGWVTIQSRLKQSPHFLPWTTCRFVDRLRDEIRVMKTQIAIEAHRYMTTEEGINDLLKSGGKPRDMYFREVPGPNANRVIQFEAMLGPQWRGAGSGVELCYELNSTKPLRGIRERGHHCHGLDAQMLLRQRLSPESYDMLTEIWGEYPTAIIEATEFSERCGVFNEHLIVFEVRDF